MFEDCELLTSIDLSTFVDINLKNITNIFYDCPSLKYIDISSIEWKNKEDIDISNFKADYGKLIIKKNLYSHLINTPDNSTWNITYL